MNSADFDALVATLEVERPEIAAGRTVRPRTKASEAAIGLAALPGLELVSVLGRGGMGVVWSAEQRTLDRIVAVKRLGEPPFGARELTALLSEARTTGALEHPAVVPVHDLGLAADGSPLLVMKRIEGTTLGALVADSTHAAWEGLERRHGDRLAAIVDVMMRVSDALEFAHGRGFVHRDVKCDNVMVGAFGEVYLLDWGVALRVADARDEIEIVGTPASMAPEMARGDARKIDARSDVYLLGATLHHALTGRPRHQGATLHAVLLAAFLSEPPVLEGIPAELASLVRRATAADPVERPASAARFREELAGFLRHRASTRLVEDALTRLRPLEGAEPSVLATAAASRALTEARFALTRAIEEWPENVQAVSELDRVLELCVLAELGRASPGAAVTILGEMRAPSAALIATVHRAEGQAAQRDALATSAIAQATERDASLSASIRKWMAGVFVVVTVGFVGTALTLAGPNPGARIGYGTAFVIDLTFLVASLALLYATHERTLVNRWSRDAVGLFIVAALGTSLSHGVGWLRGDDIALRGDAPTQVVFATLFGVGSLLLSRRLLVPALLACLAAVVSALWPASSLLGSAVTIVAGALTLAWTSSAVARAPTQS